MSTTAKAYCHRGGKREHMRRKVDDTMRLWVYVVLTAMGSFMSLFSAFTIAKEIVFLTTSSTTTGTVISFNFSVEQVRGVERWHESPIVRFTDAQGNVITFDGASNVFFGAPQRDLLQKVPVRYAPHDSWNAQIDDFYDEWETALLIGLVGVGLTRIGSPPVLRAFHRFVPHFPSS